MKLWEGRGLILLSGSLIVTVGQTDGYDEGNSLYFPKLFYLRYPKTFVSASWCQKRRPFPAR